MHDDLNDGSRDDLPKQPTGGRNWVGYALVASVGLNLLVVGMIGGLLLRGAPKINLPPARSVAVLGLRPYYRALNDVDRRALLKSLRENKAALLSGPTRMKAHLSALAEAVETEPFDENMVIAVLEGQAALISEKLALGHRLLLDRLRDMTPERRADFAQRLRNPPRQPLEKPSIRPQN